MEAFVFFVAAAVILVGAVGVVVRSNPVHAALSLVLTLFGVAVLFVAQDAHFLAAVQVIVYAGAIVVLFLFVLMLLGVDRASFSTLVPGPSEVPATDGDPLVHALPPSQRICPSTAMPSTTAAMRCPRKGSAWTFSSLSTPTSMITNRNSTTMAPA